MTPIARVLITLECERHCEGCCNTYQTLMSQAIRIDSVEKLVGHEVVCITGGEPMLDPSRTIRLIDQILANVPCPTIYLYTALYRLAIIDLMPLIDGIHFTLHAEAGKEEIDDLGRFQQLIASYPNKSYRLYIDPRITRPIGIFPYLWHRVEVKPWMPEGKCPLPPGETLYILGETT